MEEAKERLDECVESEADSALSVAKAQAEIRKWRAERHAPEQYGTKSRGDGGGSLRVVVVRFPDKQASAGGGDSAEVVTIEGGG